MSRIMKIGGLAIVLIGFVAVIVVHVWLGTLIKTVVERIGPQLTKTTVTLDDVNISLLRGHVQIEGLAVGNPQGFQAPTALKVGKARIRVQWTSALSNTVVIDEILVEAPDITFEGLPRSNLSAIQENVKASVPAGPPKSGEAANSKVTKKLLIKEFTLTNGKVEAHLNTGPLGSQNLTLVLPDIHLKDIGKESGGATPEEAVSAVFAAITRATTRAITDQAKQLGGAGSSAASKAVEDIKGLFK